MKKLFSSMMFVALAAMTFTACEDVPEPYDKPGTGSNAIGGNTGIEGGEGDGSLANPFNSVAALNYGNNLASGQQSADYMYIKGKVSSIKEEFTTNYGNGTFYISDDGTTTNQFYAYRVYYLGNKKFAASDDQIKVGDEVIVCGIITNYNGTIETAQNKGFLYSLNGVNRGGEPGGGGGSGGISGENLLTNGDFETWTDGQPDNWKTASAAGNATLTQSNDAHGGSYSVSVGFTASANKRLGYKELTLKAGTYTYSFYAKSTTTEKSQTRAGYVDVVDGTANQSGYKYGDWVTLSNTAWAQVSTTFTLDATTTVSLLMMNPKSSEYAVAQDILVDDASLVTSDGGIDDSGSTPGPGTDEIKTVTIAEFNAAAESTSVWYKLTGTISNLSEGDLYGNFDLTDASGSVYVYGVLSEKGGAKKKFQELVSAHGITNGTTITIIGNRGSYGGKIEVTNAYFVSASN